MAEIDDTTNPGWTPDDALAAGKTHLAIRCACGTRVDMPFRMLAGRLDFAAAAGAQADRLICRRCGARATVDRIGATAQSDATGYVTGAPKTWGHTPRA